jgi:hypothetical protein
MKKILLSFDIQDEKGNSLIQGKHNTIASEIIDFTTDDIAKTRQFLKQAFMQLYRNDELKHIMPDISKPRKWEDIDTLSDNDKLPYLVLSEFHSQIQEKPFGQKSNQSTNVKP